VGTIIAISKRSGAELVRDPSQFADDNRQADHNQASTGHDRAGYDQGIAEAELLDGNPEGDRHQTGHEYNEPGDQKHAHRKAPSPKRRRQRLIAKLSGLAARHFGPHYRQHDGDEVNCKRRKWFNSAAEKR
jgi:hypothetical protein